VRGRGVKNGQKSFSFVFRFSEDPPWSGPPRGRAVSCFVSQKLSYKM